MLNNPTTLIDPLGLDTINCTIRNGCREPGGNGCTIANGCRDPGMNLGGFGGSCYIDGLPSFCNVAYQILNAGSGGTTVSSVGGFLTFQVPIPPGAVQSTLIDPLTGQPIGSSPGTLYAGSFQIVSIPGIKFISTGPTTATFRAQFPFAQTVQKFKSAGFVENPQDYIDFFHPGQLDLRDMLPFCSTHVAVNKGSGQLGPPTTGDVHLDAVNPGAVPFHRS